MVAKAVRRHENVSIDISNTFLPLGFSFPVLHIKQDVRTASYVRVVRNDLLYSMTVIVLKG